MREPDWDLVAPDGQVLGYLTEEESDFPWLVCQFEPTEAFAAVADLFAEDARLIKTRGMASGNKKTWTANYDRIEALGLELHPRDARKTIEKFPLLHIDGKHASFRGAGPEALPLLTAEYQLAHQA